MATHYFGIRHHGPGSAKNLLRALQAQQPDMLLIEGPPEAEHLLQWVTDSEMLPPVAILAYVPDQPQQAIFYPFAEFSPEWQAIAFGVKNNDSAAQQQENIDAAAATEEKEEYGFNNLAAISGLQTSDEWWDQFVERNMFAELELFDEIANTVTALREDTETPKSEAIREAFMRMYIRKAENEMYQNIAVITGAWHTPALKQSFTAKHDQDLTKKLPKSKVECTWIPWSNQRLMFESGYGAGIVSPGWYKHQWIHPDDNGVLWLVKSAQLFRQHQKDISPAHVIESVRLANALMHLRNLNKPGLNEFNEATQAVMCMGESEPLILIRKELIIGKEIGSIPQEAPQSPLQQDFEKQIKSLRFKLSDQPQIITLDLRNDFDLKKSVFIHRLLLLGVKWGSKGAAEGKGTFKELWTLTWHPEMMIDLIAQSNRGNSIETAVIHYLNETVAESTTLAELTAILELAIPAELQEGITPLLNRIDAVSSTTTDSALLLNAILPLAEIIRYGNVRNYDKTDILRIFSIIYFRISIGLPIACTGIDEKTAQNMANQIESLYNTLRILDIEEFLIDYADCLLKIHAMELCAPFIAGTITRILKESNHLTNDDVNNSLSQALTLNIDIVYSAQWLEGFLNQSVALLIHDDDVWTIVSGWVKQLNDDNFNDVLPLLRRTFSSFRSSEKNKIAERVKYFSKTTASGNSENDWHIERAEKVIPIVKQLFGL